MSGHSKWKTIQHKKGAADAKRGKIFSKMAKEFMVVARAGGSDPVTNATLRNLMQKAKSVNMPLDNIERAIKKGAGELEGVTFHEIVYEGYAGGGVGLIAMVLTDNKNRAAAEIRHVFTKHGSDFAGQGSVTRGFTRRGQIFVDAAVIGEDKLMALVLEAGAEDMVEAEGQFEILTDPTTFADVMQALEKAGIPTQGGEVAMVPHNYVPIAEKSVAQSVLRFVADLEDHDDVQNVYTNMDVDQSIMKDLQG